MPEQCACDGQTLLERHTPATCYDRTGTSSDDVDEYNRDERIETIYQSWGAREMAERIVALEDELGADVDGMCTGMHADVAEAQSEIERLEGDCIRLSEELDEARAANAELANDARDAAYWEAVADRMRGGIFRLEAERDRYRSAWSSARARARLARSAWRYTQDYVAHLKELRAEEGEAFRTVWETLTERRKERDRYRLAWISARRRAVVEANYGQEAMDFMQAQMSKSHRSWNGVDLR